jgi:molybdate/tungstate transport system ATP-binding protein
VVIEVRGLSIRLGAFHLQGVDLKVEEGESCVIVGPTGAGKTVLVECVAGLQRPDAGSVWLGIHDVTAWPPERRAVAYVPQDHALFPHRTVRENIAFALRLRRVPAGRREARVAELASMFGVEGLLDRRPLTLSGGERQRVAIARALAILPRLLLLDEPLASLDARTRERLAEELRSVQRRLGTTTIHVSHDFEETRLLADRVAVLLDGRIHQSGSVDDVFERPATRAAALFLGCRNVIDGEVVVDGAARIFRRGVLAVPVSILQPGPAALVVRPEALRIEAGTGPGFEARILRIQPLGPMVRIEVESAGEAWTAVLSPREAAGLRMDGPARLCLPDGPLHAVAAVPGGDR